MLCPTGLPRLSIRYRMIAKPERTAILVRCTKAEAELIREAARRERRTLSGYILNSVLNRIQNRERVLQGWRPGGEASDRRGA